MKVKLSIRQYINWIWLMERGRDIRKELKKLSDIPLQFLPKFVFLNEIEYIEATQICSSTITEEGMDNLKNGKDIDIEWIDDFDYQKKLDEYKPNLRLRIER